MLEARVYNFGTNGLNCSYIIGYDSLDGDFDSIHLNRKPCNYLAFDGNGIDLYDNSLKFFESGDSTGYTLSDHADDFVSDENCEMPSPYLGFWLTVTDYTLLPQNITIQFYGNCCSEVVLRYVAQTTGKVLKEQTVTVTDEWVTIDLESIETSRIEMYFPKTVLPHQCVRINSIFDGTVNRFTQFTQQSLIEEINVLSDDLPINQFECSLAEDITSVASDTKFELYNNHKFYGEYYVRSIERTSQNIYNIVAQNVLCHFDDKKFEHWYYYKDEGAVVGSLTMYLGSATNSNVYVEGDTTNLINGPNTDGSCRVSLCEVAYALAKMVYSSRTDNNSVYLIDIPTEVTSVITNDDRRIIGEANYKKNTSFSNAEKKWQLLGTPSDYQTKSVSGNIGDIVIVTFDKPVDIKSISGGFNSGGSLTSFVIALTATTAVITYAEYPTVEKVITIANLNQTDGTVKSYSNFLTYADGTGGESRVERQNENIQKYISSKGTVTAKIRLRNEKVGDLIQIETAWDGIVTGIITKMTISFGYEDIADIEVLEWSL